MIKSQLIIFTSKYAYPPGTLVICVLKEGHLSQFPFFASHIQWMAESWSFCLFNISLSSPLLHSWHFSGHHHPRIWWLRPKHDFSLSSSDLNLVHLCIVHLYMGNSGEAIPIPRFRGMFGQSSGNYIYIPYYYMTYVTIVYSFVCIYFTYFTLSAKSKWPNYFPLRKNSI